MQWMQDLASTMFWALALMTACWLFVVALVFGAMRAWRSHGSKTMVRLPTTDDERRVASSRRAA
jgi:hypothetical protein